MLQPVAGSEALFNRKSPNGGFLATGRPCLGSGGPIWSPGWAYLEGSGSARPPRALLGRRRRPLNNEAASCKRRNVGRGRRHHTQRLPTELGNAATAVARTFGCHAGSGRPETTLSGDSVPSRTATRSMGRLDWGKKSLASAITAAIRNPADISAVARTTKSRPPAARTNPVTFSIAISRGLMPIPVCPPSARSRAPGGAQTRWLRSGRPRSSPCCNPPPAWRPVAVFEETLRRHPGLLPGVRRTLKRRVCGWRWPTSMPARPGRRANWTAWPMRASCRTSPPWRPGSDPPLGAPEVTVTLPCPSSTTPCWRQTGRGCAAMSRPALPNVEVATARLPLPLGDLRLPAIGRGWAGMGERSDREGWPAARFLSARTRVQAGPCGFCRPADTPPPRR